MALFKKISDDSRREISPNEPQKKGIFLFFELFLRKFWNYIVLNLLYSLTSIISFAFYWFLFAMFVVPMIISAFPPEALEEMATLSKSTVETFCGSIILFFSAIASILMIVFFGGGVCTAGFTYVLRNYVRQENAYIFADYFEQTKKNFGQALILSVIDKIVVSVAVFSAVYYYFDIVKNGAPFLSVIAFGVLVFALLFYAVMHTYLWTIMVTFKVTIKQLFKNSFMLTVGTAVKSVICMICLAIFAVGSVMLFASSPLAVVFLFLLILMSVSGLILQMFSYPTVKKYMIDENKGTEE